MTTLPTTPDFAELRRLAAVLHQQSSRFVLATTGGGTETISALLTTPGASKTVLEAVVPYSQASLADWIGATPDQFCSPQTARAMAAASWVRARKLAQAGGLGESSGALTGWGATCSLATDRPKRGAHRAWTAIFDPHRTIVHGLHLAPTRDRPQEERLVAAWMLNAAAEAAGVDERITLPLLADDRAERFEVRSRGAWRPVMLGEHEAALRDTETTIRETDPEPGRVLFPGSFNPLHDGHRLMAATAERKLGRPVEWEIAVTNVDKPPLDHIAMAERLAQFRADEPVWFTCRPRFVDKAKIFHRPTFIVGVDTIRRIADPRYYQNRHALRDEAVAELADLGARFLVFPRLDGSAFVGVAELDLPPALAALCDAVPSHEFRCDLSSTELRRRALADE